MLIQKAKFLLFPSLLGLLLVLAVGCGSPPIPAAAPLDASTGGTQTQNADSSKGVTSEAMDKDAMAKSGESMDKETMAKSGESMDKDAMAKSGESMGTDAMAKSGESMDKDAMAKSGESMDKSSSILYPAGENLTLEISGLQPLENGFHYEGWAIIGGLPVSTGKFNVSLGGGLMDLNGAVVAQGKFGAGMDLTQATVIALTIEPPGDSDSTPSSVKYLAGDVSGGSANLSVAHAAALGNDFTGATAAYILATPTDGADTNETSGIWYIDLSSGSPMPGLDLPALPPAFEYEGWVIIDGTPVSTGKFSDVAAADSGNLYNGPEEGKPFPGEDFLNNAPAGLTFPVDLRGKTAAISIEPVADDSPGPFALKPLVGGIPANAEPFTNYQLDNQAGGFPTGTATIK